MDSVTRYVGLDYHQESVQVCVMEESGKRLANRNVENGWREITAVVQDTLPESDREVRIKAAIESCCGASNLAEELMDRAQWIVTLAHPGIVNRMRQNPDKSDKTDAYILADLMRLNYLPHVWLAPDAIRQLRSLVRYRQRVVKDRTRCKLRLRGLLREHRLRPPQGTRAWSKAWLSWLLGLDLNPMAAFLRSEYLDTLKSLDKKISKLDLLEVERTEGDALVEKLMQIEGIGLITAVTMRAEIVRFDRFRSGKQLSRFCGVTPRNASSGQRQADAGLVKAGNPGLRIVLVEAAHRLMNFSEHWKSFALRLKKKGKPYNVIVAAVANRWLRKLYHEMQPENLVSSPEELVTS